MAALAPHPSAMTNVLALSCGTELAGDFRIERVLGAGGFGITYLARDLVLDRAVTIKEYFPIDFAARGGSKEAVPRSQDCAGDYQWGLDRFIAEAKTLAQFDHRHIVKVFRYFQENSTAYMVLQFEEGRSLKAWQNSLKRAPRQGELDQIVGPLLEALEVIHSADFLHRDIAPDNIIVRTDGSPVLIDFGSARGDIARHSRTVSALVKPGYSPYEQYAETGSQQGPWTDIYALGATLYHVVTGKRPPDSPSRIVKDGYVSAHSAALGGYRQRFLDAIDHALQLDIDRRPRSIAQWRGALLAPDEKAGGGIFRRKNPTKAVLEVAPTVRLAPPIAAAKKAEPTPVPPPPDAPGQKGGFLDFIDGLKPKGGKGQNKAPVPADKPASLAEALVQAKDAVPDVPAQRPAKESKPKKPIAASKPDRSKARRRPRAVRSSSRFGLRPVLFKLLIGAALATFAVAYQNQIPRIASLSSTATGSATQTVRAPAKPPELKLPGPFHAHTGSVRMLRFANRGGEIVTAGPDGTLKRWDAKTGAALGAIAVDVGAATSISVRDGRVASGHGDGTVAIWDLATGAKIAHFKQNEAAVWSVAFADSTSRVLAASHDWSVRLWDASAPARPAHVFEGHGNAVQAMAYAAGEAVFVSGGADKSVKLWDLRNLDLVRSYRGHNDFVTAVAISNDGRRIAGGNLKGRIRLWSTQSSKLLRVYGRHSEKITSLAFSPSGSVLASASVDGTIRLWNLSQRRPFRAIAAGAAVNSIAFSPDGRIIAAGLANGNVRLWGTSSSDAPDDEQS